MYVQSSVCVSVCLLFTLSAFRHPCLTGEGPSVLKKVLLFMTLCLNINLTLCICIMMF